MLYNKTMAPKDKEDKEEDKKDDKKEEEERKMYQKSINFLTHFFAREIHANPRVALAVRDMLVEHERSTSRKQPGAPKPKRTLVRRDENNPNPSPVRLDLDDQPGTSASHARMPRRPPPNFDLSDNSGTPTASGLKHRRIGLNTTSQRLHRGNFDNGAGVFENGAPSKKKEDDKKDGNETDETEEGDNDKMDES